jgi:SpoVK/Ycf46/Vps4 family AAA+-type ATPase
MLKKIVPKYNWDDIVLPPPVMKTLHSACDHAKELTLRNRGASILFHGPLGTGKTMAVHIMATELKVDLYRISLSQTVSKYIGETEKNLNQIFDRAVNLSCILFFDEADELFGKRTEVQDDYERYTSSNLDFVWRQVGGFQGISIFAINPIVRIDHRFLKRFDLHVEFPFPDDNQRIAIWKKQLSAIKPNHAGFLAKKFQLTGGGIRNAIQTANKMAKAEGDRVDIRHLESAAKKESQMTYRRLKKQ